MVRISAIGSPDRRNDDRPQCSVHLSGMPVVRTDMVTDGQGSAQNGTSISGKPSRLGPPLRTFSYTPTICQSIEGLKVRYSRDQLLHRKALRHGRHWEIALYQLRVSPPQQERFRRRPLP